MGKGRGAQFGLFCHKLLKDIKMPLWVDKAFPYIFCFTISKLESANTRTVDFPPFRISWENLEDRLLAGSAGVLLYFSRPSIEGRLTKAKT